MSKTLKLSNSKLHNYTLMVILCSPIQEWSHRPAQFPQTQGEEGEAGQEEEEENEGEPRRLPHSQLAGAC